MLDTEPQSEAVITEEQPIVAGLTKTEIDAIYAGNDEELKVAISMLLTDPYFQFVPRPDNIELWDQQESFVNSPEDPDDTGRGHFNICLGGNGSGKTQAAAFKTARYLRERTPPRDECPFWVIGESFELACGVCWGEKLSKYLPKDLIHSISWFKSSRNWPAAVNLKHPDDPNRIGWVVEFKSYSQGREAMQARSIGGYWFNEEVPLTIVEEVQARCRDYGSPGWADFTPLKIKSPEWRDKHDDPPSGWNFYHLNTKCNTALDAGWVDWWLAGIPEDMRDTRQLGMFTSLSGQVFKDWRKKIHVIPRRRIPRDWKKIRGIDYGHNNPTAVLWIARDHDRNYYVYDEHYEARQLHDHHAKLIKSRPWDLTDPHTGATYGDHDPQEIAEYAARGIYITPANKTRNPGIEAIKSLMVPNPDTGKPRLFVMENCENLIKELPRYRYPDQRGPEGNKRNAAEDPIDCDDHAIDALRYAIFSEEIRLLRNKPLGKKIHKDITHLSMPKFTDSKKQGYGNLPKRTA